jgi:hypothetical protein
MFKIIKGTFHVRGYQPDGDSIRFQADNAKNWVAFKWTKKQRGLNPKVQLRLEGIDALEIHYNGYSQPRPFGLGALERMLAHLGITGVRYSLSVRTIIEAQDNIAGFIAVTEIDDFNRPICLAFPAGTDLVDGDVLDIESLPIGVSVNYRMCLEGLVYPTFYTTTHPFLIELLTKATQYAREGNRGLWVIDHTQKFDFYDIRTIFEDILILPKLFRRLVAFCETSGDLSELDAYLKKSKDNIRLLDGSMTTLDALIQVSGRNIMLIRRPEELLFMV